MRLSRLQGLVADLRPQTMHCKTLYAIILSILITKTCLKYLKMYSYRSTRVDATGDKHTRANENVLRQ